MKKIFVLLFVLMTFFLNSCFFSDDSDYEPKPEPQSQTVSVKVFYNGTANLLPGEYRRFYVGIFNEAGDLLESSYIDTNPGRLKDGVNISIPGKYEEGSYQFYGFWDWNMNGDNDSYEQETDVKVAEVDGFNPLVVDLKIKDLTSSNAKCWIEGAVTYNGSENKIKNLYARVADTGYNVLSEAKVLSYQGMQGTKNFETGLFNPQEGVIQILLY